MLKILRDLLRYNREFLAGAILLGIILVMVALSFVSPYDERAPSTRSPPDMPPSLEYWFGTTSRGEDVFWADDRRAAQHAGVRRRWSPSSAA